MIDFINVSEHVRVLGKCEPTHILGGRLDYALFFSDPNRQASLNVVDSLVSDHFAILVEINACQKSNSNGRKRLQLNNNDKDNFIERMGDWFDTYAISNDVDTLTKDLCCAIEKNLSVKKQKPKKKRKHAKQKINNQWYWDEHVGHYSKVVKKVASKWRNNQSDENREALKFISTKSSEIKQHARENYWLNVTASINRETSLREVWAKINKTRGKTKQVAAHPNPGEHAEKLIDKWCSASSNESLPNEVRMSVSEGERERAERVNLAISQPDLSDAPITDWELRNAIKKGPSTAPGDDGITYDILEALIQVRGNPLLHLFNCSYSLGKLPSCWKEATIIPIPKANKEKFLPISLTSCMCKMMERILLNRLLSKIDNKLHVTLNGYRRDKGTSNCIASFLSNKTRYSCFIDLKGAFDKAQGNIIVSELEKMGIQGKLLGWMCDYLKDRKAKVFFQGKYSTVREMELGTPQGGVASPTLFNVLMNIIANIDFPEGVSHVGYADDILIQASSYDSMQASLKLIEDVCKKIGFIINVSKTRAFNHGKSQEEEFVLNGEKVKWVPYYNYLGVIVGGAQAKNQEVNTIIHRCQERLRPLKAMAWNGRGASILVLRMMYIAFVRSVIDYAAPVLIHLGKSKFKKIETIQNDAMRIILGCPKTAKIINLRYELNLPSLWDRIREINVTIGVKILRGPDNTITRNNLAQCVQKGSDKSRSWTNKTVVDIEYYELVEEVNHRKAEKECIPPWEETSIDVSLPPKEQKKSDVLPIALKVMYQGVIDDHQDSHTDHIYTDGSVNPIDGRSGSAITLIRNGIINVDHEVGIRIHNWASSTQTELVAILLALSKVKQTGRNAVIFSDSMAALSSLTSDNSVYPNLIQKARKKIKQIIEKGNMIKFVWIPAHVGIKGNERADNIAKNATSNDTIAISLGRSIKQIKSIIKQKNKDDEWQARNNENGSRSNEYYDKVALNQPFVYGSKGGDRRKESVIARLRLGYPYLWEKGVNVENNLKQCKVCGVDEGHNLHHYVMECPSIAEYRMGGVTDVFNQAKHLINKVPAILKRYPGFASAK